MKVVLLLILVSFSVGAQNAPADKGLDVFFKEKTTIENPLDLRDPFKSPNTKSRRKDSSGTVSGASGAATYTRTDKGEFANVSEIPLNDVDIYNLKVVGVLIGKERRAMILPKSDSKQVVVIKEGAKLGADNAEVKAILPGGIVLVEKIVNVYGQEEYLETVIPISR